MFPLTTVLPHLSPAQALGCILYLLCFKQHPFEDGAKLQIVNGKYSIPQNDVKYTVYHDLIRTSSLPSPSFLPKASRHLFLCRLSCRSGSMLKVNPEERLSITELVNLLQEIAAARNVNPKSPITEVGLVSSARRCGPAVKLC